jgi:hypothetical protein
MIKQSKIKELRNKNDKYLTPYSVTQQLLDMIDIDKQSTILEPCCSVEKTIVTTLEKNNFSNITYNIYDENKAETNFLIFDETKKYDYIITNTPYGNKNIINFVNKMKKVATKRIYCLYQLSMLCGTTNYNEIWSDTDFRLKEVYILVRPVWLEETIRTDGKYKTGITQYAWFCWDKDYEGEPIIKHIDNTNYVLRKKDLIN